MIIYPLFVWRKIQYFTHGTSTWKFTIDEPKVHQVNSDMDAKIIFGDSNIRAGNILKYSGIQFGTLCSDEIHCKKQGLCSIGCQLTNGIFMGSNFLTKVEKMKTTKYVNIGSLHVEITGADPT